MRVCGFGIAQGCGENLPEREFRDGNRLRVLCRRCRAKLAAEKIARDLDHARAAIERIDAERERWRSQHRAWRERGRAAAGEKE